MTEPQKDDISIIFSEDRVNVGDKEYSIKPWTLKQLIGIWPLLSVLTASLQAKMGLEGSKAITANELLTLLQTDPQKIIEFLLPYIPKFFSLSIKDMSEEDALEIDAGVCSVILLKILSKNIAHLKNSLSLVVGEMATLTGAMTQPPSSEQ